MQRGKPYHLYIFYMPILEIFIHNSVQVVIIGSHETLVIPTYLYPPKLLN